MSGFSWQKFLFSLREFCCGLYRQLQELKEVFKKEFKILVFISISTFFLILFNLCFGSWNIEVVLDSFLSQILNFFSVSLSILATGSLVSAFKVLKLKICNKDNSKGEQCYWISVTFLDRVAAFCLSLLGIVFAVFPYLVFFYKSLDAGDFSKKFSICDLLLIFMIWTFFLLGLNIISKYFSEEIKKARKENRKMTEYYPVIFSLLYLIFFIPPSLLIEFV